MIALISLCPTGQKDTEKRTKGTHAKPFVCRDCGTPCACVCERFLERGQRRCACVCVCVSKISGTAKYKALKVARKPLFPRRPLLPLLIFSFAVIIHTVNCSPLTRDYRFRCKVRQNLLKMQIFYREIPQKRISLFPIPYFVSKLYGIITLRRMTVFPTDWEVYSQPIGNCAPSGWDSCSQPIGNRPLGPRLWTYLLQTPRIAPPSLMQALHRQLHLPSDKTDIQGRE